ncbi:MAG: exonuclease SbcCD subunit D C-terminal domain-containing protein, partial [Acinetobacter sp.]
VIDYVALGHLHKPQKVGQPHIRYSGSPIPLSFSEINYKHQIVEVRIDPQLEDEARFQFEALLIPRSVSLHRLRGELNEIFEQIRTLEHGEIEAIDQREYIDIEYHTATPPPPNLRQTFEDALPPNRYRLVRISRQYQAINLDDAQAQKIHLEPPTPKRLFEQLWLKQGYSADDSVLKDFLSLIIEAEKSIDANETP